MIRHACVNTISPSDIIVGLYNDTIKLNLHFEWTNKNNITLSNNQTSFTSGYSVTVTPAASNAKSECFCGGGGSVMINGVATLSSASSSTRKCRSTISTVFIRWQVMGCM